MIPNRFELDRLVKRVSSDPLEREAALGLIYLMLDPIVPSLLSAIITDNPNLITLDSSFTTNLAYGVADGCLEYRYEGERVKLARRIFKQLISTSYYAKRNQNLEIEFNEVVANCYWSLYKGFLAAEQLSTDRDFLDFELSILVEELINNLSSHSCLMILLLQNRLNLSKRSAKMRFYNRVKDTVNLAKVNKPQDQIKIITAENDVCFSSENMRDSNFTAVLDNIEDYLTQIVRF